VDGASGGLRKALIATVTGGKGTVDGASGGLRKALTATVTGRGGAVDRASGSLLKALIVLVSRYLVVCCFFGKGGPKHTDLSQTDTGAGSKRGPLDGAHWEASLRH
jgi:hypothetical protein